MTKGFEYLNITEMYLYESRRNYHRTIKLETNCKVSIIFYLNLSYRYDAVVLQSIYVS